MTDRNPFVYVTVSSTDRPGWADSFLLDREKDPAAEIEKRYRNIKIDRIQICETTKPG